MMMKRILSLVLVLVMLSSLTQFTVPAGAVGAMAEFDLENLRYDDHVDLSGKTADSLLPVPAAAESGAQAEETEAADSLAGKTISILGASISTFAGTSNGEAADSTNSTIRSNAKYYPNTTVADVTLNDTWWMQVCHDLGLRLLVNNAWSGSAILLNRAGTVGAYVDRCIQLHDDTGTNAGEEPDIICIQMGFNDFSYGKSTLGTADIDYDALITADGYGIPATTMEATAIMLDKIVRRYPGAEVYMFNHFRRIEQTQADTTLMEQLNAAIETVCERFDVEVVDLYTTLTAAEHIGDGNLHPNCLGMDVISEAVKTAILSRHPEEITHAVTLDLKGVSADYGTNKRVADGDAFTLNLTAVAGNSLEITVTMGGRDITDSVYADGAVTIDAVTDDVTITAESSHEPRNYRWELTETGLVGADNPLTLLAGTVTEGQFSSARYKLSKSIVLCHDLPWVVEWRSTGDMQNPSGNGARLFNHAELNNTEGAPYIFKSSKNYIIAIGERKNSVGQNYGLALADHGIDGSEPHTYRLENRIAANGSNMVYLYVDGEEVGPMDHYYQALNDTGTTSDWLNGKDFTFSYMGTASHALNNCSIEYIQVWEAGTDCQKMSMRYDDRLDLSGRTAEILDAGTPTSYRVGYGVEEHTVPDTAVVTLKGDTLIATGIGTAKVRIDGTAYEVTVTAAPISLLLLIGQSNAEGMEGTADQSIVCPDGQVYSTYAKSNGLTGDAGLTVENAGNYVPSALTGVYSSVNLNGTDAKLSGHPIHSLTEAGMGKYGMDSGLAYEWVQQTGEKVWVVNASHGGSSITSWQKDQDNYDQAVALLGACQTVLQAEIAAGHYIFSHMGYYWNQGCADETRSAEWYVDQYLAMHEALKIDLARDMDGNAATPDNTLEFGNIVLVQAGHSTAAGYRKGTYENSSDDFFMTYKELEMRGPRVAQIWMANNPELTDIHIVSTLAQNWVTMPDGTDGVAAYFQNAYPNGTVDYPTQVQQSASWYTPTTPAAVKDSIHYNQIGYNEIGRESARNTLYILDLLERPEAEVTVSLLDWTGYQKAGTIKSAAVGVSDTLVVPLVHPCYESKTISYTLSDGLTWNYYDLLDADAEGGTLTASTGTETVRVAGRKYYSYRFELVDGEMVSVSDDIFRENTLTATSSNTYTLSEPVLLKHDKEWFVEFDSVVDARFMALASTKSPAEGMFYFFKSRSGSGVLSIGEYKDGLYQNYGLQQANINIDWTQPHVYRFQNNINDDGSNIIYIYIDDVWVGTATNLIINDVLRSTDHMYLSGKDFAFTSIGCSGFGLDSDQMTYLEVWENVCPHRFQSTVTVPTCTEQGYTTHTCTTCGDSYVDGYTDATGHSYSGTSCTVCGAEHPNTAKYSGKVISILSASTSTFAGYIPTADGFNLEHRARYPQDNLLTDVNETWWMQVINELDAKLGINDSWAGSQVLNTMDGNSGDLGEDAALASLTRIQNLGANGTPDLILFYGGGNDMGRGVPLGSFDPKTAPTQVDMTATKWNCFADAYVAAIMRLQHFYPDTEIVVMMSHEMPSYVTAAKLDKYGPVMKAICEHYGVKYVELRDCGITFDMLPDNIHPNAEGMDCITADVLDTLLNSVNMDAGENVVCPVTHNLTNAGASLHYYKGVSEGVSFIETITGENVMVTVTMGGVDVTASVYKNGVISIPAVSGDVIVTAKGAYNVDGHLQQLPDNFCAGTNLWTALKPENTYYTANGWGNTSEGTSWSITFPVEGGTRIWATSFGAYPGNGSSANGVRVTWFDENGLLKTVSRDVVYAEFAANGYLTAPERAVAMNLPMTHNREDYEVYLLSAGHSFGDWVEVTAPACDAEGQDQRTCTVCGEAQYRDTRISGDPDQILVSEPVEKESFSGKKIVCIGDSITYGVGVENRAEEAYPHLIADLLDMTAVNLGVSGSGYCTGGRMATNKTLTEANIRDADVVTILLGINDWAWAVKEGFWNGTPGYYDESETYYQLGEFGSDDTSTFYGALKKWCETIAALKKLEGFEEKQFVVITPMITSWNNSMGGKRDWDQSKTNVHGHTLRQYCTAILEVCAEYGIPVFDANMFSGIYYKSAEDNNVAEAGGDGVHINAAGHALLADALTEFLLEGYRYEARTVPDCGHSYERTVTAPTCTEQGYTTHTCTICGDSYVDGYTKPTGEHSYSAGQCTACGKDTVTASLDGNVLTLTGELAERTRILAACYDGGGRFTDLKLLIWQSGGLQEELPAGDTVRLFFVNDYWTPLRQLVPLR